MSTKKEGGDLVYSPDKINPEFYKFYKSLDTGNSTPLVKTWLRGKHSFYWKIYIYMIAAIRVAFLESTVGSYRNHFWCLHVKKKKVLSYNSLWKTALREHFFDRDKNRRIRNEETLLHSRSCKPFSIRRECVTLLTTFTNVFSPKFYLVFYRLFSLHICLNLSCLLEQRRGYGCFLIFVLYLHGEDLSCPA